MPVFPPRFGSVTELVEHWACALPMGAALRFEGGELTYPALLEEITGRTAALRARGPQVLGVLCGGGPETVLTIFSAMAAKLRVVLLDENASEEVLKEQMKAAGVSCLFGDEELREALSGALALPPESFLDEVIFFTSGTTERSKGVILTEKSLISSAFCGSAVLPLSPKDTLLSLLPLCHVFGFVCGLLWGLQCGAAVALGRGIRRYQDDFSFYRPTAVSLVPALLKVLLQRGALNTELELLLIGAGDCPPALLEAAVALKKRVSFGYGLTELSSGVALSLGDGEDPYAMTVCPGNRVRIAEDGEILVEAPDTVMKGYLGRPSESAAALEGGALHTGDLGRLDGEGRLFVTGRKKEMLVLSDGTKLYLPEAERDLMRVLGERDFALMLSGGAPALVIRGEEQEREALLLRLRSFNERYPRGQQIRRVVITPYPLPRTATGKIQRWEVQKRYDKS